MSYTKTTNFGAKDSLPSGDTNKIVKGTEFDVEFNNIQTAINQQGAPLRLTGNPFQQAAQTFQNLVGMGRNPDNPFLSELQNPQLGVGTGVSRNPFAIEAEQLARGAARNRFGSLFANRFLPTSAQVLQDFQESEGFGRENTFLPFLQQRFGLG